MKTVVLTSLSILIALSTFSQQEEKWTAFRDSESELIGFKNSKDDVMLEPLFMGITSAKTFDNIIAAMEHTNGHYKTYYLTKLGRKVGKDSLYISDNNADCESEGFIRFSDKKTNNVGLFDNNGNIAVPAVYNSLSRVSNGVIWALKDATKDYWDNHKDSGCDHYTWQGGQELLLSNENKILIEDFKHDGNLDFYSMQMHSTPSNDSTKVSFKGVNGMYYSFTNIEKEFSQWLKTELIPNLTIPNLESLSMDSLTYWKAQEGWMTQSKKVVINKKFALIKKRLQATQMSAADYFTSIDGLNPFIYTGSSYDHYFNNCGEANQERYPVIKLIINDKTGPDISQDHLEFLKTDDGYRLISITIGNGM